jgi:hypothetical protein
MRRLSRGILPKLPQHSWVSVPYYTPPPCVQW